MAVQEKTKKKFGVEIMVKAIVSVEADNEDDAMHMVVDVLEVKTGQYPNELVGGILSAEEMQ